MPIRLPDWLRLKSAIFPALPSDDNESNREWKKRKGSENREEERIRVC